MNYMTNINDKNITLSLCMIVRDEEKNLGKCLESIKDLIDEIIIVDTGSKDNTIKLAEGYGAIIYYYKWNDNFADARNESIKYAKGDWILVLDADEIIDEENKKKIKSLINKKEDLAYYLNFKSKINPSGAGKYVYNAHPRLFQNHKGIFYQGRIHEEIASSVKNIGGKISLSDVEIEHFGYENYVYNGKNKVERNIEILKRELVENPKNGMTYFYLGESYSLMYKWDMAVYYYKKGIDSQNIPSLNLALLYQNLGTAFLHLKKYDDAVKSETNAVGINPYITTAHLVSAQAAFENKNYDKSIWELNCFIEKIEQTDIKRKNYVLFHQPDLTFVYSLLGSAYLNSRNYETAEKCFIEVINESGDTDNTYYLLSKTALGRSDLEKSERYIKKAIDVNKSNVEYYVELGNILGNQRKFSEAEEVFEIALNLNKKNPRALKGKGLIYLNKNEIERAISEFEKIENKENDVELLELLAESYMKVSRFDESQTIFKSLLNKGIKKQNYYYFLGKISEVFSNNVEANQFYKMSAESENGISELYFISGNKLLNAGLCADAINAYNQSIKQTPHVKEPRMNLALVYIKKGDFQKAVETYLDLLKIDPMDKKVKKNLAGVYAKLGDIKNAEKYLLESKN